MNTNTSVPFEKVAISIQINVCLVEENELLQMLITLFLFFDCSISYL